MRSRREILGGLVGSTALFSGCIGALQSDGDGDSADNNVQRYTSPVGSILISPSITTVSAEVQVSLLDAESVIVERNGREITTFTSDTNNLKVVDEDVEPGDLFELVAVFPDGSRETVYDRCYDCENTEDDSSGGENTNEQPDPSASFWFGSMAPLEGYLVDLDLTVGHAESVAIFHEGIEIVVYQEGGEYDLAGNEEDDRPLLFEEIETGDRFRAVARFEDGSEEQVAEEFAVTG
ncbi:hypothetical protein [Salinarchaeum laminariae]|uniref:hypothetical protein n=1 Tax=Salinarchaeum laminariae TaxID=869888 RepID=UPI0020C0A3BF|nr:hypothetical protein [Salinarchaeum laminariae]